MSDGNSGGDTGGHEELPADFPEWLTGGRHAHYTRPPRLALELSKCYPRIDNESELYRAGHREVVRQHDEGTTPEDMFRAFRDLVREAGGALPVALVDHPDGERLLADPAGDTVLEFGLDEDERMELRELSSSEVQNMPREELVALVERLKESLDA